MYYECHITIDTANSCRRDVEALGWSFSQIAGDPILGKGRYSYATQHFIPERTLEYVIQRLQEAVSLLRGAGWLVVREKVELVLHDKKRTT